MKEEILTMESTSSSFNFDDISDSEDIFIMDIPKTVSYFIIYILIFDIK